ncbi:MAG: flavodoxin, partial [Bacillota bacterium]|nr:flavodoxin [Bacillota bacterium]
MKKTIVIVMSLVFVLCALAGCGSAGTSGAESSNTNENAPTQSISDSQSGSNAESGQTEQPTANEQSDETAEPEEGGVLVVYYSATGNTEGVGNRIAALTGADVFELEPVDPYTSEDLVWSNSASRTAQEYANPETRNVELVANTVDNWDSYDT